MTSNLINFIIEIFNTPYLLAIFKLHLQTFESVISYMLQKKSKLGKKDVLMMNQNKTNSDFRIKKT